MGHATRRRVVVAAGALAVLLACAPLRVLLRASGSGNVACGATIVDDLRLEQDLTCAGTGLIVGADGIKLNLNGHSIIGPGAAAGIVVAGRSDVTIAGGTVANFVTGIQVNNSTGITIRGNTLRENGDGVDFQAGNIADTAKDNAFLNNRSRGIMIRSGTLGIVIKENTFAGNRVGVLLFGAIDAIVKANSISASGLAGIRVNFPATGNLIAENTVASNPVGIDFLLGPAGGPAGNTFLENTIATNTCGLRGPSDANTFKENLFQGNAADVCAS